MATATANAPTKTSSALFFGGTYYGGTHDPWTKSEKNPLNLSRTENRRTHDLVPSDRLLTIARDAADELAQLAMVQSKWKYVAEKNNTMIYEMSGTSLPSTLCNPNNEDNGPISTSNKINSVHYNLVKGVTTINADVYRVLETLATRDSPSYQTLMRGIFNKEYVNGVVIDKMSPTTPPPTFKDKSGAVRNYSEDDSYIVNWLQLQPIASLTGSGDDRDFTLLSYQDTYQCSNRSLIRQGRSIAQEQTEHGPSNGQPRLMGVHTLQSVSFKEIPEHPKSKRIDRHQFRHSGFVIEETNEPGTYRLSLFLALVPTVNTVKHVKKYKKWLQQLVSGVGNLKNHLVPDALTQSQIQKQNADHCFLCLKMFRTLRRRHHCRVCGEAVCSQCSRFVPGAQLEHVDMATDFKVQHLSEDVRSCSNCIHDLMLKVCVEQRHSLGSSVEGASSGNASISNTMSHVSAASESTVSSRLLQNQISTYSGAHSSMNSQFMVEHTNGNPYQSSADMNHQSIHSSGDYSSGGGSVHDSSVPPSYESARVQPSALHSHGVGSYEAGRNGSYEGAHSLQNNGYNNSGINRGNYNVEYHTTIKSNPVIKYPQPTKIRNGQIDQPRMMNPSQNHSPPRRNGNNDMQYFGRQAPPRPPTNQTPNVHQSMQYDPNGFGQSTFNAQPLGTHTGKSVTRNYGPVSVSTINSSFSGASQESSYHAQRFAPSEIDIRGHSEDSEIDPEILELSGISLQGKNMMSNYSGQNSFSKANQMYGTSTGSDDVPLLSESYNEKMNVLKGLRTSGPQNGSYQQPQQMQSYNGIPRSKNMPNGGIYDRSYSNMNTTNGSASNPMYFNKVSSPPQSSTSNSSNSSPHANIRNNRLDTMQSNRNDMIRLDHTTLSDSHFVEFNSNKRESVLYRKSDGRDMIPLDLSGKY